jgi:hypothetical protein
MLETAIALTRTVGTGQELDGQSHYMYTLAARFPVDNGMTRRTIRIDYW